MSSRKANGSEGADPAPSGRSGHRLTRPGGRKGTVSNRVNDKIKKRISSRYAEISSPTNVSVPAVPALPIGMRPAGTQKEQDEIVRDRGQPKEDPRVADLRMLDQDTFDPDVFLKTKLATSTEGELKSLQSSLQSLKDSVAMDLQRNVFQNYAEFVMVSKEVSIIENEMLEFKDSLAEWKNMPSMLHIDDSASAAERRRNVRSSVADLRVLYANQMQTLHSQIEGSSKFVPTTPGRHVITEMDGIMSLNPATYKVAHSVRFVLLDDAVLVARRRRRRNNTESDKLIAERCWPLSEMLVLDTKDTASMSNVFKIRHNKETHVFRTELAADKKNLLTQFRHVAEELAAKRRKEREGEHQRRKTLWEGDRSTMYMAPDVPPIPDFLTEMGAKADLGSDAKEKAERDARWVGDFTDELTVAIALRQWEKAVALVEEGESKQDTISSLSQKLTPLKTSLTAALLQSLSLPSNKKSTVILLSGLLLRLKAGAAARNTLLTARSEVIRKCVRMIAFEGSISSYIADLAMVVFTGIKHTADMFLFSFKEYEVSSSFVQWAKEQIEQFATMFKKQVYGTDVDQSVIDDAVKITLQQSKKLLEDFGLDFRYRLENLRYDPHNESSKFAANPSQQYRQPEPLRITPSSTPTRSRSPVGPPSINIATPQPSRIRPPQAPSSLNIQATASKPSSPVPPSPRTNRPGTPSRSSPAPPPRSRDRPSSSSGQPSNRPPPVNIPRRDGMI